MIDKINRKLSVKKFQGGGINTIPQSPFTLQGMQQSISTQWPKVAQWAARNPKLATLGTAGLNTPAGRLLWGLSLASPLIKKGLKMAVSNPPMPGETIDVGPGKSIPFTIPKEPTEVEGVNMPGSTEIEGVDVADSKAKQIISQENAQDFGAPNLDSELPEEKPPHLEPKVTEMEETVQSTTVDDKDRLDAVFKEQEEQTTEADASIFSMIDSPDTQQRSQMALELDRSISDLLGPRGRKTKNLLLLQLAANLISGRTDKPGFKGFLDVLGQAGQNVIPMAMALERDREEDEMELKKALILADAERPAISRTATDTTKYVIFRDAEGDIRKGPFYTVGGQVVATITDKDGLNPRDVIPKSIIRFMEYPKASIIKGISSDIRVVGNAYKNVRRFITMAEANPRDFASYGTIKEFLLSGVDITKQWAGNITLSGLRSQLYDQQQHLSDQVKRQVKDGMMSEEEGQETLKLGRALAKKLHDEIGEVAQLDETKPESTLARQAKMRAIQLLTSYALANLLKDKDRLAVRDIERAEKLTNVFGLFKSPTKVYNAYLELESQLRAQLESKLREAEVLGLNPAEVKKMRADAFGSAMDNQAQEFEQTINKLLSNPDLKNNPEILNQIINSLFGGIQIWPESSIHGGIDDSAGTGVQE